MWKDLEKIGDYTDLQLNIKVSSEILQTDACKRAHQLRPVEIECGVVPFHAYFARTLDKIGIGVKRPALKIFIHQMEWACFEEDLTATGAVGEAARSFQPATLKAAIAGELRHWMRDAETRA